MKRVIISFRADPKLKRDAEKTARVLTKRRRKIVTLTDVGCEALIKFIEENK